MAEADIFAHEPLSKDAFPARDLSYEEQLTLIESMMTCYDTPLTQAAGYTRDLLRTLIRLRSGDLIEEVQAPREPHTVDSTDVNDYLREMTGQDFTAKDFRTWAGTVLTCAELQALDAFQSETQAKKNVVQVIKAVSALLGNTPAVCRKCYVHPAVLESYMRGETLKSRKQRTRRRPSECLNTLRDEETAMLRLLRKRLTTG